MRTKGRRTTLTLPEDTLGRAEQAARSRKVPVSTVVAEALEAALRERSAAERKQAILDGYRRAFSGFSAQERAILDGVILEPIRKRRGR